MVDQRRIDDQRWVDARTATRRLGIQLRSLYAYVSRGLVRSAPGARGRARRYALADIERLVVRRDARAGHGAVAAGALRWGEPVLDSAITAITPRGPAYRGHLAVELVTTGVPFEHVAELLWSGHLPDGEVRWPVARPPAREVARMVPADASPLDRMALLVAMPVAVGAPVDERALIRTLATALGPRPLAHAVRADRVAEIAAAALGLDASAIAPLDAALVLLADHELNASSFAARIAASTGAGPRACVAAALATLSGPRHGRASEEVARFAREVGTPRAARAAVRDLRARDLDPPGFGHPLYPDGDPRGRVLLDLAAARVRRRTGIAATLLAIAEAATGAQPDLDLGLAALIAALGAPPEAGPGVFAIGRSAGWLAHATEQRLSGILLRPRARYVGVPVPRT